VTDERLKELLDTLNKVAEGQSEIRDAMEAARKAADGFDRLSELAAKQQREIHEQKQRIDRLTEQLTSVLLILGVHKKAIDNLAAAIAPPAQKPRRELN